MRALFRIYQLFNILSLDIVAGAIACALFFAKIFHVEIKTIGLVALSLTVWVIYTIDHLRDARLIMRPATTLRHRFHQENFRLMVIFLSLAMTGGAIAIFFIRRQVFEWGRILTGVIILYLLLQRSLRLLKELFVALLYTAGVLLLSITVTQIEIAVEHYFLIFQFAATAWANLVLFSWFDHDFDQSNDQNSLVTILGKSSSQTVLLGLFGLNFLLTVIQLLAKMALIPVLILFLMNVTLFLIYIFRNDLKNEDRYRLIGDAVFLFPAILLIL